MNTTTSKNIEFKTKKRSKSELDETEIDDLLDNMTSHESKQEFSFDLSNRRVLILYGADAAFFQTAQDISKIYLSNKSCLNDNIVIVPATKDNMAKFLKAHCNKVNKTIMHYIGHGINMSKGAIQHRFPSLVFNDGTWDVVGSLSSMSDNLIIIIDACNFAPYEQDVIPQSNYLGTHVLFTLKGFNIIAAAKKGFKTYYTKSQLSTFFYTAFSDAAANPHDSAQEFFEEVNRNLIQIRENYNKPIPDDLIILDCKFKTEFSIDSQESVPSKNRKLKKIKLNEQEDVKEM